MDENIRSQLRLPAALHEQLKDEAQRAGRSLNSEIVHRLTNSIIERPPSDVHTDFVALMADRLVDPANRKQLLAIVALLTAPAQTIDK